MNALSPCLQPDVSIDRSMQLPFKLLIFSRHVYKYFGYHAEIQWNYRIFGLFHFLWQMANTVNKQLTVIMWLFFLQFSVEQVRYLKKKKNKRNRTNGQQTGVSTKYNCGTADVGCSEDASTTLPFESGQMGKGFLIYSECLFLYFALDFFDKFIFLSYYWMCKCACILSHFIYTKAVTAESGIYLIKYYSKLYGGKVSNGRLYI